MRKNKHTYRLGLIVIAVSLLAACDKKTVDFSYSPKEPKAGEKVEFQNLSSSGEEWEWTFGDGNKATTKLPSHTYKQPGKYVVQLKMDNKDNLRCSHEITVYDTIPNFSSTIVDSIGTAIFETEQFEALVYNPYKYAISYEWTIENLPYTQVSQTNTENTFRVYFLREGTATVQLRVTLNGDTTTVRRSYRVSDIPAPALLMQDVEGNNYRQRIYDIQHDEVETIDYPEGIALLEIAQDTLQEYNGKLFSISALSAIGYPIDGFAIAGRKIYFRAGGLYVSNLDGQHVVTIDTNTVNALCINTATNRIYWARENAVMYMPLVGSDNNQFTTQPIQANSMEHIRKMIIDTIER